MHEAELSKLDFHRNWLSPQTANLVDVEVVVIVVDGVAVVRDEFDEGEAEQLLLRLLSRCNGNTGGSGPWNTHTHAHRPHTHTHTDHTHTHTHTFLPLNCGR